MCIFKMNVVKIIILLIGLLLAGCTPSDKAEQAETKPADNEKPSVERASTVVLSAVVEAVDYDARTFTLKDESGSSQSFTVRNPGIPLEKLKQGDNVTMTVYQEEIGFVAAPGEEIPEDVSMKAVGAAENDSDENITVVNAQQRTSTVEAVDAENRMVTLVDQDGTPITLPVQDDVKNLDKLKVGDSVVMQTTQVVTVTVSK